MTTTVDQAAGGAATRLDTAARNGADEHPGARPNALVVLAVAFVLGLLAARVVAWRGHAHPRT